MPGPESETLTVWISALTDTGKTRRHNEDYIGYLVPENHGVRASQGALMVVCDGVGGGSAGEVASERAVHCILGDYYTQSAVTEIEDRLFAAIQQANAELYAENQQDPEARPMSTTVVVALIVGRELLVAHAGDSRAYLARGGQITQLTTDHSWVAEMVAAGDLTPEEAEKHPWRNRITRGLGLKDEVELDVRSVLLEAGDVILLCSDGLTRHVGDDEILDTVTRYSQERAVQHLVRLANMRGGKDNISALIAEVLTETELATRLSQAEVADEETQVPVQPRRVVDRRELRRILPFAAVAALLLLLCGISVRALQRGISSSTSAPTATATVTRPDKTAARATSVPRGKTTSRLHVRSYPSTAQWNPAVGMLKSGMDLTIRFLSKQSETCTGSACCNSNIWFEVIVPSSRDAWEQVSVSSIPVTAWVCADYVELLEGVGREVVPTKIPQPPISTATTVPSYTPTGTPTPMQPPTLTRTPTSTATPTRTPTPTPSPETTLSATAGRFPLPISGSNESPLPAPEIAGHAKFREINGVNAGRVTTVGQASPPDGKVQAAVFLSDSSQFGVLSAGQVWSYDLTQKENTEQILVQRSLLIPLFVSNDAQSLATLPDNRLVVGMDDGNTQIWRAGSPTWQKEDSSKWGFSFILAASPDGSILIGGKTGSRVQIWQISAQNKDPKFLRELEFPEGKAAVHAVSFAPQRQGDSYRLAGDTKDGRVCLWHINSSSEQSLSLPCISLTPSPKGVISMALSGNGEVLATGTGDGQIRLWSASGGAEIKAPNLGEQKGAVDALAFSPDGTLLLSASENEGIKLWGVP